MSSNDDVGSETPGVRGDTEAENNWIAQAPPAMQAQMKNQQVEEQKMQELVQMSKEVTKMMHEMSNTNLSDADSGAQDKQELVVNSDGLPSCAPEGEGI